MLTRRLEIRPPVEADRQRFVELFCDEAFMVFSDGVLDRQGANRRFDEMLERADELAFAKQPVIERSTGELIGYSGVNWFDLDGKRCLEFGYRLVPSARGKGYATEAGQAVLAKAEASFRGEIVAMIDPANVASRTVAGKLGFVFWKHATIDDGFLVDAYRLEIGSTPPAS